MQARAARLPFLRRKVRREGEALFDLVQGFVSSQVLLAVVELRLCHRLMEAPAHPADLVATTGIPCDRLTQLFQAAAAVGLLRRRRDGLFDVTPRGAALTGVPGLEAMISHHGAFYRDMGDPLALLRGDGPTELAELWPYVFGHGRDEDPARARRYSRLMEDSQALVAQDTLSAVSLSGVRRLLDVGGGTGVFAEAAATVTPGLRATVFDLAPVVDAARERLDAGAHAGQIETVAGSFRSDALPDGHDAVSLVRVLYDHRDDTVAELLARVRDALPPGGRVIVSEPMSGGAVPDRATDVYFAFYTMAMGTGTVRSQARIAAMLRAAGFEKVRRHRSGRPYVTSVVEARRRSGDPASGIVDR
ncbi:hydroxyneurosporene-O-methyltransferase [Roseivivax marinus]|uniref:methyltransferase n=1 Tax=Roseivivax marinus TaxID=1379903 RepID=UPI0008C18ED6|nr:methyltransferase [Roseivivax marinus]SEL23232.1 hydroxyneurosporene-O-methyltransferase [Roseivivax marinus]